MSQALANYMPEWLTSIHDTVSDKLNLQNLALNFSPRLPQSWPEYLAWTGAALVGTGVTGYAVIRLFFDWIIDDIILFRGMSKWLKSVGGENAFYNPANKLELHAQTQPDKPFLLFEDQKYSFRETDCLSNQHANTLLALGVGGGKTGEVALFMKNCPEYIFIYYACMKIKVKLALINTNLRTRALLHCLKEGGANTIIVQNEPDLLAAVKEVQGEFKQQGVRVLVYGESDEYESFTSALVVNTDKPIDPSLRESKNLDAIAIYIYTSGTTGLPKAAKITFFRVKSVGAVDVLMGVTSKDVAYSALPLYHTASILLAHGGALQMGIPFAFTKKFSVRNFWSDCDKHGATVIHYIGEICRYLLNPPPSPLDKKHKVRLAVGNGLRRDIWKEFQSRFNIKQIGEFYAATEGNAAFFNVRSRFGCVGTHPPTYEKVPLLPTLVYLEYDIENDCIVRDPVTGLCKVQPLGKAGLLVGAIKGNARFDGYTNQSQTDKKIVRDVLKKGDLFLNSGDILCRNKDYTVHFVDRIGDTFRWKGENVSTLEVGNTITEVEPISDCCAYGVQIPNTDGRACMVALVPEQSTSASHQEMLEALQKHCEHALPSYARPIFVRFLEEMVVTGTFKHQKFKLQTDGFDETKVKDLYVMDQSAKCYVRMTADIQNGIQQGTYKL